MTQFTAETAGRTTAGLRPAGPMVSGRAARRSSPNWPKARHRFCFKPKLGRGEDRTPKLSNRKTLSRCFSLLLVSTILCGSARAAIIYTASNLRVGIGQSAMIDFDQNGISDLLLDVDAAGNVSFNAQGEPGPTNYAQAVQFVYSGIYNPPVNYGANVSIGGALPSAPTGFFRASFGGTEYGKFANRRGYAGAVIQTGTFSLGSGFLLLNTYYGWLDLEVDTTSATETLKLYGWAFESTAGTSILTGAGAASVPDTGSTAALAGLMMAGLAIGVRRFRAHA